MIRPIWPRSLATRTALVLLFGLALVQVAGLTIHALDRIDLQRLGQMRDLSARLVGLYRAVAVAPVSEQEQVIHDNAASPAFHGSLSAEAPEPLVETLPSMMENTLRDSMALMPLPPGPRPRTVVFFGDRNKHRVRVEMRLPDGRWLNVTAEMMPPRPWHSETFLLAFVLMTAAAALLTIWAVRRLTGPVRTLAAAAEALGRDVNAPPLPETGPTEIAKAAAAFNTMADRIRRFVQDRTEMLTAIGHDLRTPITRLKLRAEFMEDDEQRRKMLLDLEELEAMISATLAFGRDAKSTEPVSPLDLAELLRTVLDEAGDARPEATEKLAFEGPSHLTVRARPLSLKRALANVVSNAVAYGGGARIRLLGPTDGMVQIEIEDDGPGIEPRDLDRVFEPFFRVESSRNRETGGVGLGLPIARNILRAHGGDVVLSNLPRGGARALLLLPA